MSNAYIVMTALPPTKGHARLIDFAEALVKPLGGKAVVILCTQPSEPFADERYRALSSAYRDRNVLINRVHEEMEQNPDAPGFWEMWRDIMLRFGAGVGDFVVASEHYGQRLANIVGAQFMPYDIKRELYWSKATTVRADYRGKFDMILPEFQPYLRKTITIFGAESTGKTTLTQHLSCALNGHYVFEYARPYLEEVGAELNAGKMYSIWHGQKALQTQAQGWVDKPFIFQDTDLFSTVGYWQMYENRFGPVLRGLISDAYVGMSDLYVITKSNIPFEEDPLRYGGGVRESTDQYWIDLCERYNLNYIVLEKDTILGRMNEVTTSPFMNTSPLEYERQFN